VHELSAREGHDAPKSLASGDRAAEAVTEVDRLLNPLQHRDIRRRARCESSYVKADRSGWCRRGATQHVGKRHSEREEFGDHGGQVDDRVARVRVDVRADGVRRLPVGEHSSGHVETESGHAVPNIQKHPALSRGAN
jgi:hypothetical protein